MEEEFEDDFERERAEEQIRRLLEISDQIQKDLMYEIRDFNFDVNPPAEESNKNHKKEKDSGDASTDQKGQNQTQPERKPSVKKKTSGSLKTKKSAKIPLSQLDTDMEDDTTLALGRCKSMNALDLK